MNNNNEQVLEETIEGLVDTEITVQSLLSTGAHYGHITSTWHPAMAPYIYGTKSVNTSRTFKSSKDVYIFNLDLTLAFWQRARAAIVNTTSTGGSILFVGTKNQYYRIIEREAIRSKSHFINHKWVGGLLTNFSTLHQSIAKMDKLEKQLAANADPNDKIKFTKKEALLMDQELRKLMTKFGGVRAMKSLPSMLFVVDVIKNRLAVDEANKLGIPVVGITDTDADPEGIEFIIPANDDAIRAVELFTVNVANAVIEGRTILESVLQEFKEEVKDTPGVS